MAFKLNCCTNHIIFPWTLIVYIFLAVIHVVHRVACMLYSLLFMLKRLANHITFKTDQQQDMKTNCDVKVGNWGSVVVVSAFFIQVMTLGTSQSFGVYNIEFLRTFRSGAAAVALVGSLNLAMVLGAGPFASLLMRRYSHRQVAFLGAILANIGLIVMPFAPNLEYMYVFYGIICGLGYSFMYIPSYVLSGLYFPENQSLATGIATAGSGMGTATLPVIMNYFIQYYGWRGSLFILSGLNLQLMVFTLLLRPIQNYAELSGERRENVDNNAEEMLLVNKQFSVKQRVKKYCFSIFTVDFTLFWVSNICWNAGSAIIFIFFPEYAYSVGLSKEDASTAYTLVGVGSCIGSVVGGLLGNLKHVNRIMLYIFGNIGAGFTTLIIPLNTLHSFRDLVIICFVFGLMFGIILGLLVVVTSDMLGLEALGDGIGYLMLSNGIGVFGGPPVAGLLIDAVGNQDPAMYLAGAFLILGGAVMYGEIARRKVCRGSF